MANLRGFPVNVQTPLKYTVKKLVADFTSFQATFPGKSFNIPSLKLQGERAIVEEVVSVRMTMVESSEAKQSTYNTMAVWLIKVCKITI